MTKSTVSMGFWDGIKRFLGAGDGGGPSSPVEQAVRRAIRDRVDAGQPFSAVNVADALAASFDRAETAAWVQELFRRGEIDALGYARTLLAAGDRVVWIYHRAGEPPQSQAQTAPAPVAVGGAATAFDVPYAPPVKPAPAPRELGPNPYDAGELTRLSPAELRERALGIEPWRTAWIGRVDVIPPAEDERTALIDRGLVLRGLLTEEELAEIHRVGDLWLAHREGARLAKAKAQKSADAAIALLRKEEAERKAQKKAEAKERAAKRALEVARRKAEDIVFLGRGVSEQLHDRRAKVERLEELGLPVLATPADVARALGMPVPRLRWLAFHAEVGGGHYAQFEVPKRSGGTRLLAAPMPELAKAQRWILDNVLAKLPLEDAAHGFVPGRSTVTNASVHRGRDVVVNLDLEAFFPTITFPRVRGFFASLGYSPAAATVLALLCTESPRRDVEYAGARVRVAVGARALPQGACTSPAISNQVARMLDRRLTGLCAKAGWAYTRYADDLTFSAPVGKREDLGRFIAKVRHIVEDEGFAINEKKGRVQRAGGRQTVTGVVVNEKLGVPREELRRLRALLHNAKKTGLEKQNRDGIPHFEAHVRGKIAYVAMIDPEKGAELMRRLEDLPR